MKHAVLALAFAAGAGALSAQEAGSTKPQAGSKPHVIVAVPGTIEWVAAPDILPAGARLAVLEGNPAEKGEFTMRLWMPANYRIPPHYHPVTEHVTVVSGTFYVGMGDRFDPTGASTLPSGTFAALAPGMRHFAFTKDETVIQLHGTGPWSLVYVNPADDPRRKAR